MIRRRRTALHLLIVAVVATALPLAAAGTAHAARAKTITINDVSLVEGNGGSKALAFTVKWSGSKGGGSVSVGYATADATAEAGSDYTAKTGTVSLPGGGCRCGTISIAVLGDNLFEGTETFAVNLSSPVNATIADPQGVGTIYDNEGPPSLIASDASAGEADGIMSFSVLLTSGSPGTVTVDYATVDGTATAGADYEATSGTLTFTSGQTSKSVAVTIDADALSEDDETFTLELSDASITDVTAPVAVGTVVDDDTDPDVSIADASVSEADAVASFVVTLSAPAGRDVDVDYATSDATATAGADYASASGTVHFAAGEVSNPVDVTLSDDATYEGDETLAVTLSGPSNATLLDADAVGTIADDDPVPALSIDDPSVTEGNAGPTAETFTVSLSNASASTVTVDWSTVDGSAVAGSDYETAAGSLTFLPGEVSHTVDVTIDGDVVDEATETFDLALANAAGATVADGTGSGTILDDDRAPTALTVTVKKTTKRVKATGVLEPAATGMKVRVTLQKKKGTRYVKVSAKLVSVKAIGDRDADGRPDATFLAAFPRPAKGAYRFLVRFGGSPDYLPSTRKAPFRI